MGQIIMRRRYGSGVLPYDARVEWLESTGTQYINTGVYPYRGYTFDTKVAKLNSKYNLVFWGCRSGGTPATDDWQCYLNSNDTPNQPEVYEKVNLWTKKAMGETAGNWYSGIKPTIGTMYSFAGITVSPQLNRMTYPIVLFGFNMIGSINTSAGICRIGLFTAYSNGEKVVDMIPVRVGNVGYMYDKVSRQLFGNAGTGTFVVGPDVV